MFLRECSKTVRVAANCSIALSRQGVLAFHVPVLFHPVSVAREECFWNVQAAQKSIKMTLM